MGTENDDDAAICVRVAQACDVRKVHAMIAEQSRYSLDEQEQCSIDCYQRAFVDGDASALLAETTPHGSRTCACAHRCAGTAVGVLLFSRAFDAYTGPYVFIEQLFIMPRYRRRHIGRRLCAALSSVRVCTSAHVHTTTVLSDAQVVAHTVDSVGDEHGRDRLLPFAACARPERQSARQSRVHTGHKGHACTSRRR
ncbi:unnamed protein product [Sphagnum balticum]